MVCQLAEAFHSHHGSLRLHCDGHSRVHACCADLDLSQRCKAWTPEQEEPDFLVERPKSS